MIIPLNLVLRSTTADASGVSPQACKPFNIHYNVCVGDLVVIIACSIAGLGFFIWAIHAVRKMRHDPFDEAQREAEERQVTEAEQRRKGKGVVPSHAPTAADHSLLVEEGLVDSPKQPRHVYYDFYRSSGLGSGTPSSEGYLFEQHMGRGYLTPVHQSPATRPILNPSSKRAAAARELAIVRGGGDYASYASFDNRWLEGYDDGGSEEGNVKGSPLRAKGSSLRRPETAHGRGYGSELVPLDADGER